jgi:hypothetical protein
VGDKKKIAVFRWQLKMRSSKARRMQNGHFIGKGTSVGVLAHKWEKLSEKDTRNE